MIANNVVSHDGFISCRRRNKESIGSKMVAKYNLLNYNTAQSALNAWFGKCWT
jgi:hypothetical protein